MGHEDHMEEKATCSTGGFVTFTLGLISGTFSALSCKIAYDTRSTGIDGHEKTFAKPIMMLLLMFAGMVPAIFFWLFQQFQLPPEKRDQISYRTMAILIVPSLCDLLCTLLLLVAQLYITASLWQMMRGSIIVITALLKRYALSHRLKKHMWLGVSIITIAMILVASTSFFGNADKTAGATDKDPRVGILLVLVGCIAQGVQYVFEEKVMAVDNAPPLVVIGCEGIWGTILTIVLVYPIAYALPGVDNGSFENPYDAIAMISNSPALKYLVTAFVLFVTIYNCMAVYVTKYLSAIWHAILDNFRPITIWGMGLMIHYMGTGYGEAWVPASWLQLTGLIILLFGTAVYNGSVITFSDVEYEAVSSHDNGHGGPHGQSNGIIKTELAMASPSLSRSPLIYKQLREAAARDSETEMIGKQNANNTYYQSTGIATGKNRSNEV